MSRVSAIALCVLASTAVTRLGVALGDRVLAPGTGYPTTPTPDLFRFDAVYYRDIATRGYAYDGDPASSPNVVFAPLFPLLTRLTPWLDPVTAGFAVNMIALTLGIGLLLSALTRWFGPGVAFGAVLAQVTAAGSYALHAYYAESVTLAAFALALWALAHRRPFALALAGGLLGGARAVGLVPATVIALDLLARAGRREVGTGRGLAYAALALAGSAGYLGYLAWRFGNPFVLLPEIQGTSWRLFHPATDWIRVVDGGYLAEYVGGVFARGFDIRAINLGWTCLMLAAIPFGFARGVPRTAGAIFAAYALATYALDASSEFLISAHRFAVLMTPIYLGGARLIHALPARFDRALAAILLAVNAGFALWHAACFNRGWWFWF